MMMQPGALVLCHFSNPTEKFWGVLEGLDPTGLVLRGISLSSFDDWVTQIATNSEPSLGLSTMFVPLLRVERVYLDEQVGEVGSYAQRFEERVGASVESYLGLDDSDEIPS